MYAEGDVVPTLIPPPQPTRPCHRLPDLVIINPGIRETRRASSLSEAFPRPNHSNGVKEETSQRLRTEVQTSDRQVTTAISRALVARALVAVMYMGQKRR